MGKQIPPKTPGEPTLFQTTDRAEVNKLLRLDGWYLDRVEMDSVEGTTYTLTDRDPDLPESTGT